MGMSLWVTKNIIEKMDGKIRIFSTVGHGTAVIVSIPCESSSQISRYQFENIIMNHKDKKSDLFTLKANIKALVVEDSPINLQINQEFLKKCGVKHIDTAINGFEGVKMVEKQISSKTFNYNLICMDIEMPLMNGKEAVKRIREIEAENSLPPAKIIFISGNCIEKEVKACLDPKGAMRANEFLRKPVKLEVFTQAFCKIMKQ